MVTGFSLLLILPGLRTWTLAGGRRSKAAFVGAKIVTGSGPPSLSASPDALRAVTREEKVGLTARVSNTVQVRPHVPAVMRKIMFVQNNTLRKK